MRHCRSIYALVLASLLTLTVVGCSQGNAETPVAATPDEAVELMAQSFADGKFEVIWRALPPSYQQDVTEAARGQGKEDRLPVGRFERAAAQRHPEKPRAGPSPAKPHD